MLERSAPILRILCVLLAALIVAKLTRIVTQRDPLASLNLPSMAALSFPEESAADAGKTHAPAKPQNPKPAATNALPSPQSPATNAPPAGTNGLTNPPAAGKVDNAPKAAPSAPPVLARGGPPLGGPPGAAPILPPEIKARVDRVTQSGILGMVIPPAPMALLGIGGNYAFLRAPNGQTGVVSEGEELGGVKILRIGTNRILVEDSGQKKELMIHSGLGSDSLMPK